MPGRGVRALAFVAAAFVAAGCGTTVKVGQAGSGLDSVGQPVGGATTGQQALGTTGGTTGGFTGGLSSGTAGGVAGGPLTGAATGTAGSGASSGAAGGSATAGRGVGPPRLNAPGVTATQVVLGIHYGTNNDKAHAAVGTGAEEVPSGEETKAMYQAIVDDANRHGGLFGRKIVPVWHAHDALSQQSPAVQDQDACATFTQDHKVFAVLVNPFHTDVLYQCLAKAGAVMITAGGFTSDDREVFRRYPNLAMAGGLELHRLAEVYIEGLVKQGFLTRSSTIGLVTYDSPEFVRAREQSLKPALARHGLRLTDMVEVNYLSSAGAVGTAGGPIQSAVLSFSTKGVDRVLFLASSGMAFVFMTAAESQQYRPRYGLNSNDTPGPLATTAPAAQLVGSVGVGWVPAYDLNTPPKNAEAKRCEALMQRAGFKGTLFSWTLCDHTSVFLRAARAGTGLTAPAFNAGLQRLGVTPLATVMKGRYGGGRRDGAGAAAYLAYGETCACFRYTSKPYDV